MSGLRALKFRVVERIILNNSFVFVSQNGSHKKYKRNGKIVIIPRHPIIDKGMVNTIRGESNKSREEFINV